MLFASTYATWTSEVDDESATALAAKQDPDAFIELDRLYVNSILRYCYRRLELVEAAEDATSQVFERALSSIHQYRGGSFRVWLFRIASETDDAAAMGDDT